ncbi:MAG: tyrosine-type recombinase/integrase [Acetivibrio ethanolgignens]
MGRWNNNNDVEYKDINIGRRDLFETINYNNAYNFLEYVKYMYDKKGSKIKDGIHKGFNYLEFLYDKLNDKEFSDVTEHDAEEYVYYLSNELHIYSVASYIYEAGRIHDFLIYSGKSDHNPFEKVKMYARNSNYRQNKKLKTNSISIEQIQKVKEDLPDCLRMYMMFSVSTGAKSSQIREMKWNQVDFENRIVRIDDEILYFSKEVSELLQTELERRIENKLNDCGYVFRSHMEYNYDKDAPIPKTTISNWCTQIGELLNIPNLRHLDFRHSMIRQLLSASGSVGMTSIISNYPNLSPKAKNFVDDNRNNDLLKEYKDICEL